MAVEIQAPRPQKTAEVIVEIYGHLRTISGTLAELKAELKEQSGRLAALERNQTQYEHRMETHVRRILEAWEEEHCKPHSDELRQLELWRSNLMGKLAIAVVVAGALGSALGYWIRGVLP